MIPMQHKFSRFGQVPVSVVVLAAGQGKRMNSALPKVLQPLAGRPMLEHVLATARKLSPTKRGILFIRLLEFWE